MKYLQVRFGNKHSKKVWYIPYDVIIETAGEKFGLSKAEIKRLDKQKGIHLEIVEGYEKSD